MEYEQEDPAERNPRQDMEDFVKWCAQHPDTWYVLTRTARGNFSTHHYRHHGMEWKQKANGDGTKTFYGRFNSSS